ncbi:MAG: hypothetical protein ACYTAF_04065, partial [Planctomycetota bacterium]
MTAAILSLALITWDASVELVSSTIDDAEIERLVGKLGAADIGAREEADAFLRLLRGRPMDRLERHWNHRDPEVRGRVRVILLDKGLYPLDVVWNFAEKLGSADLVEVYAAVDFLLKVDRTRAIAALTAKITSGDAPLAFRAAQLSDILSMHAAPPLRYGILLLQPTVEIGEAMPGLEIWINESDHPLMLKDWEGTVWLCDLDAPEPKEDDPYVGTGWVTVTSPSPRYESYELPPGQYRIATRKDLAKSRAGGMNRRP